VGVRFDIETSLDEGGAWNLAVQTGLDPAPEGSSASEQKLKRYSLQIDDLTPGQPVRVRVTAVRVAADPVDDTGLATRPIYGPASAASTGRAIGALAPPNSVAATYDALTQRLAVSWLNDDPYEVLQVGLRAPDAYQYNWSEVPSPTSEAASVDGELQAGRWSIVVRALGFSRKADSSVFELEVP
jgi:hypothetical protein